MTLSATEKLDKIERRIFRKRAAVLITLFVLTGTFVVLLIPASEKIAEGEIVAILPLYAKSTRQNGICKVRIESGKEVQAACKTSNQKVGDRVKVSMAQSHLFAAPKNRIVYFE